MAFFDRRIECANKITKHIRVRSEQGGADRRIYVNCSDSGYYLGNGNNRIYSSGREVSSSSIPEFAKQNLWFYLVYLFKTAYLRFFSLKKQLKLQ